MMFRTLVLALALSSAQDGLAQASPAAQGGDTAVRELRNGIVTRRISLASLGFGSGISFRQLAGRAALYVPVPKVAALRGGRLELSVRHGAAVAVTRYLQVSVAGRPVAVRGLTEKSGRIDLRVDLTPDDVTNGFIAIDLGYSGAFSDQLCMDERASGDFLTIDPASRVDLDLDAAAIATPADFAAFRPEETVLSLRGDGSLAALATATRAAALFGAESGRLRFGGSAGNGAGPGADEDAQPGVWRRARIAVDGATSETVSEMSVELADGMPRLLVGGRDPQVGLWQLASGWVGLAGAGENRVSVVNTRRPDADRLMLSELNGDLRARDVVASEDFLLSFGASDLPAGRTVTGVEFLMAAALDPGGRGATASVHLNDVLLGNRPLSSGAPETLSFDVPEGLIGRDNILRITVQRQAGGGECRYKPQGYPAQILPASALTLGQRPEGREDFFALRQDFGGGVQVVLDPDLGRDLQEVLPWLAGVAGAMIPDRARIVARGSVAALEPDLPFLVVSAENPGDDDPLVTFGHGRVEIRDTEGAVMFSGQDLARIGVVQVVSRGQARGLWLRPGDGPAPQLSPARPLTLDRGDLALLGAEGLILATATDRSPLVEVVYPDITSLAQIVARYRPWILGGVWVLMTLVVLIVFQRIYRARRAAGGD